MFYRCSADDDTTMTTPEPPTSTESAGTVYDEATQALVDAANAARTGDVKVHKSYVLWVKLKA